MLLEGKNILFLLRCYEGYRHSHTCACEKKRKRTCSSHSQLLRFAASKCKPKRSGTRRHRSRCEPRTAPVVQTCQDLHGCRSYRKIGPLIRPRRACQNEMARNSTYVLDHQLLNSISRHQSQSNTQGNAGSGVRTRGYYNIEDVIRPQFGVGGTGRKFHKATRRATVPPGCWKKMNKLGVEMRPCDGDEIPSIFWEQGGVSRSPSRTRDNWR